MFFFCNLKAQMNKNIVVKASALPGLSLKIILKDAKQFLALFSGVKA
jgi:hypothetical protein